MSHPVYHPLSSHSISHLFLQTPSSSLLSSQFRVKSSVVRQNTNKCYFNTWLLQFLLWLTANIVYQIITQLWCLMIMYIYINVLYEVCKCKYLAIKNLFNLLLRVNCTYISIYMTLRVKFVLYPVSRLSMFCLCKIYSSPKYAI